MFQADSFSIYETTTLLSVDRIRDRQLQYDRHFRQLQFVAIYFVPPLCRYTFESQRQSSGSFVVTIVIVVARQRLTTPFFNQKTETGCRNLEVVLYSVSYNKERPMDHLTV